MLFLDLTFMINLLLPWFTIKRNTSFLSPTAFERLKQNHPWDQIDYINDAEQRGWVVSMLWAQLNNRLLCSGGMESWEHWEVSFLGRMCRHTQASFGSLRESGWTEASSDQTLPAPLLSSHFFRVWKIQRRGTGFRQPGLGLYIPESQRFFS